MPVHHPADELIPTIGYIRVSLAREEMISPELQRESIIAWAKSSGHRIIDWVIDLDKTGRNFKRRIMSAIERVEAGEAKVIAVWKISRFGRSSEGTRVNLARVERAGGQVLTSAESFDTATPEGRLGRGMVMEFNTYESDRAGVQWKETHKWRRDNGLPAMGRPRFGYEWRQRRLYNPDGSVIMREEKYEPHPERGPLVAKLYERVINGESFRSIAFWLNANGFETVRGEKWSSKAVLRFLDSGFAAGYLRLHANCPETECYGNCSNYQLVKHPTKHHAELITEETWQQYLKRRAEIRRLPPRVKAAQYPFTGLTRCGVCQGAAKRLNYPNGETQHGCILKHDKGPHACQGTRVKEKVLETALLAFLQDTAVAAIEESAKEQEHAVSVPAQASAGETDQQRLQAQVTRLEKAISKHMKTYALSDTEDLDGLLEKEYRATLSQLGEEKAGLMAELEEAVSQQAGVEGLASAQAAAVPVAVGLLAEWATLPPARINFLLRQVVSAVVLRADGGLDIHPVWGADAWSWTVPTVDQPLSKAASVRVVARQLRREPSSRVTSQQISDELARQGVMTSADYVRAVLSRDARLAIQGARKGSDLA